MQKATNVHSTYTPKGDNACKH